MTPPTVSSTAPANSATGVAVNSAITATFSEPLVAATVTPATFTLSDGGTVAGSVTYSGVTAMFTPSANLAYSTSYTATITTGVTDLAGNALAANYVWTFTTGTAPDMTPPTVSSTAPANSATGVAVNSAITATFSEPLVAATVTPATFTLSDGGTVAGSVTYSGVTAMFTPSANLAYSTSYTATITTGVTDLAGNALAANYVWTFTTGTAPATLDAAFNSTGIVTTSVGASNDFGNSVAIQSDGKIVVTGSTWNGVNNDFAVARYNPDGTLDAGFNSTGIVTTPVGAGDDAASSVAIQSDGKIVVAGSAWNGVNNDFAVARYNPDGTLDAGFNSTGIVTTPVGASNDFGNSVAIQSDGKIVVAGSAWNGANNDFAVVRYNPNGTLDAAFNAAAGKITTPVGSGDDYAFSVAIQSDGKIVVAGNTDNGSGGFYFAVARYNPDGTLDAGFNSTGIVTTPIGAGVATANSVAIQSDGKIVLAGNTDNGTGNFDFAIVRYNPDGTLDAGFNSTGIVTTPVGSAYDSASSVAVQSDGKIVAAGSAWNGVNNDFAVARYNPNGTLDAGFNSTGIVTTPIGAGDDIASSVAIQSDGKIVVAGSAWNGVNNDFAVVRYWP